MTALLEPTPGPTSSPKPPSPSLFGCFMVFVAVGAVILVIAIAGAVWFFLPEDGAQVGVLLGP
jgi:hypothetical protein